MTSCDVVGVGAVGDDDELEAITSAGRAASTDRRVVSDTGKETDGCTETAGPCPRLSSDPDPRATGPPTSGMSHSLFGDVLSDRGTGVDDSPDGVDVSPNSGEED